MDKLETKLFEAATQNSIASLHQLLKNDPLLLDRAFFNPFNETPLHVAAMLGHLEFVEEIIGLKPELVHELNSHLSSPLHLAAAKGHVGVVKALLSVDNRACLVGDRNELLPLHLAAAKGRVEAMKVLLEAEPDAIAGKSYGGESILHLCVKSYQLEALRLIVESVGSDELINSRDGDGNTVLHLAVAEKQVERHDERVQKQKSSLMVVASLIATVAFQLAANPPGGVWQDDMDKNPDGTLLEMPKVSGDSVFAYNYPDVYESFYFINTVAFMASLSIIWLLMSGLPITRRFFTWILMLTTWTSITALAWCYLYVLFVVTPKSLMSIWYMINRTMYAWIGLMGLLLLAHTILIVVKLVKMVRKVWTWWRKKQGQLHLIPE